MMFAHFVTIFHFYMLLCFQGVQKWNIGLKRVKQTSRKNHSERTYFEPVKVYLLEVLLTLNFSLVNLQKFDRNPTDFL